MRQSNAKRVSEVPSSHDTSSKFEQLRKQAEELIRQRQDLGSPKTFDVIGLIHELNIHQAELEIQNEELKRAQQELSESYREYEPSHGDNHSNWKYLMRQWQRR